MHRCHICGDNIPEQSRTIRSVRTGTYSGGGAYYRAVNLCSRCDVEQSRLKRVNVNKAVLGVLVSIVAAIGVILYALYHR